MPSRHIPMMVCLLLVVLIASSVPSASAATYRHWIAQEPSAPSTTDTVRVWMDSDTVPGETAGVEYHLVGTTTYVQVLGTYDNTSFPGANWYAEIPPQSNGVTIEYQLFTRNEFGNDYGWTGFNWSYTVGTPAAPDVTDARALWLEAGTIAWNGTAGSSYGLLFDPDGGVDIPGAGATQCPANPTIPCYLPLTANGTIDGASFPKNPNAGGLRRLELAGTVTADTVKALLKGQTVVVAYDGSGVPIDATASQIQGVLDELYIDNGSAGSTTLGVTYDGEVPTVSVWAPTARNVTLKRYADATTPSATDHPMALDPSSGVWSVTVAAEWDRQYYRFAVEVYVPETDSIELNEATDPYAVNLSEDGAAAEDVRSQFVDLTDADLKPSGWDGLSKPPLANPEDIVVYEVHVRDFSRDDATVPEAKRGTYAAFTETNSDGMQHLLALQEAGLTHVHLLPVFDIASVIEPEGEREEPTIPIAARDSDQQQAEVGQHRAEDGFNWGYDPYHYGAPEGTYSTNPADTTRILEFREMVQALNQNGLRVVMDVVYNHTAAAGQADKSVLDRIVPGYYYRYNLDGTLEQSSCCPDTASEYAMFEKLMIDTLERWATAYKVDGFRFDLMNLHTVQNVTNARDAVQAIDGDIYVYGEGWDFGSAAGKGLTTCPNCYAKQSNMAGTGIGTYNDKIRDAAHGGYDQDPLQIRRQGFINGVSYDWNGYLYNDRDQVALHRAMDTLRSALRGSGTDWNGHGSAYTADPQESVPYISKHDNETLFDQNIFKLPNGEGGTPVTPMAERVRAQNMGLSVIALAQGIPFFHMGSDILRSKSLDRNSYDSGDWFNRVDWSYTDSTYENNFGVGLPPAWDNSSRWPIMAPLLADTSLDPSASDAQAAAAHLREMLRIRKSSPLFRLTTEAEVNSRVNFANGNNAIGGLIAMTLSDADDLGPDLDPTWEYLVVLFNANKTTQSITLGDLAGNGTVALHPVQADSTDADPLVQNASFNSGTGTFTVPERTTAVFVATEAPSEPSTLNWVGDMYPPAAGEATGVVEGTARGLTVYLQVYHPGVTPGSGQGVGIECYVHWGQYGEPWSDLPMAYKVDKGNNDEYRATIPTDALNPGTYGFTGYCKFSSESGKRWREGGDGLLTIIPANDHVAAPDGGVFIHLFEWRWEDVAKECTYLADEGFTAVQVSPPMEHVPPMEDMGNPQADYPWWVHYQPVTHDATKLESRSGTLAEFQSMVSTCSNAGVDIYVDAVINHTTGVGSGTGTADSSFSEYDYPQYDPGDFHYCGTNLGDSDPVNDHDIDDYGDRHNVQQCELVNLADLDTSQSHVQDTLRNYMQALLDMGVAGFRLDASKHMAAQDIAAITDGLQRPVGSSPFVFQEVIESAGEPVKSFEYTPNGDVTEFRYSIAIGNAFNCGAGLTGLQYLSNSLLDSKFAVVFTDNHDNQRGHGAGGDCVLDHRDGFENYNLGNIFVLAYPYGYPKIISSYYWSNDPTSETGDSKGPPSTTPPHVSGSGPQTRPVYGPGQPAGALPENCSVESFEDGKWACEHRRPAIANMVEFRAVTAGEALTDWQTITNEHIAFGRGEAGFVAINHEATRAPQAVTYQAGMEPGIYCDVTQGELVNNGQGCSGRTIAVSETGQIVDFTLGRMDAFAIHSGQKVAIPTSTNIALFDATGQSGAILVTWSTLSEAEIDGFHLYRNATPDQIGPRLTDEPINAQMAGLPQGASYEWLDQDVEGKTVYYYWLETLNADGSTTVTGPVDGAANSPTAVTVSTLSLVHEPGNRVALGGALIVLVVLGGGLLYLRRRW